MGVFILDDLLDLWLGIGSSFLVCRLILCSRAGLAKEMSSISLSGPEAEGKYFSSLPGLLPAITMSNESFSLCLAAGLTPVLLYVLITGLERGTIGSTISLSLMIGLRLTTDSATGFRFKRTPVAGDEGDRLLSGEAGLGRDLLATLKKLQCIGSRETESTSNL